MAADKYSAIWVSHTSIADFLKCPRSYFLRNVYKDPKTRRKIQLVSPSLSLGMAVHNVLESLSTLPTPVRFSHSLLEQYEKEWSSYSGEYGGFLSPDIEHRYKERGAMMLRRVQASPGPLRNRAVKIAQDLPHFFLSEEDNIILCGKIDWLEYLEETDSVHIIDFKTSKSEESPDSLQLPIYTLLVARCQRRQATKASYWYLEFDDGPQERPLPSVAQSEAAVLKIAKQIALARKLNKLECRTGGCRYCSPFEAILRGEARYLGVDPRMNKDNYILQKNESDDSVIL